MRRTVRGLAALSLCLYVYGQTDSAVGSDSPMGQLTYCLENGSGSALTPECTSAAADLKMIATIAANAPDTFSTGDNAILKKICDQGADGNLGCAQQLLEMYIGNVGEMPRTAGSNTCSTVITTNNAIALGIWSIYFTCTSSDTTIDSMCLPTVGKALYNEGLSGLIKGEPLSNFPEAGSALCAALGKAGCCGGAFLELLNMFYSVTCDDSSKELLATMVASCASPGVPATCPAFTTINLPPYTQPTDCNPVSIPTDSTCGLDPGACPETPCELLCDIANSL